jgi:hypothetical protein
MSLTREQIDIIRNLVKSSITIPTLKDDVMDHLWCEVERNMSDKKNFSIALKEALYEVAPHGLDELQHRTLYLLHSPKVIFMRKIIYATGLISAAALSLGWMFSLLHWPGGYELFNSGFLGFLMLFVPMLAFDQYKRHKQKALLEKIKIFIGTFSSLIVGLSAVFKLFHLQGADVVLVTGVLAFTFGFLPFLFFTMYKKAVSRPVLHGH